MRREEEERLLSVLLSTLANEVMGVLQVWCERCRVGGSAAGLMEMLKGWWECCRVDGNAEGLVGVLQG